MSQQHAAFTGSVPENYDRYPGPALFEPFASDIVKRLRKTTATILPLEITVRRGEGVSESSLIRFPHILTGE
jgi:hypothetical protein